MIGFSAGPLTYAAVVTVPAAEAQISGDGSLGTLVNGSLTDSCTATLCTITGGTTTSGSTLLHSFEQFTSPENAPSPSALFVDPGVRDIVVRVTGGSQSFINGLVGTNMGSTANLFFVNPSGITFGANAQLDIGGSFLASTADEILFDGGVRLATGSEAVSNNLLTVSAPIGLGFLPDSASQSIQVRGTGNRLTIDTPETPGAQFVNRIFQQPLPPGAPFPPLPPISQLAVRPGQTLSLVADGVDFAGGSLASAGGQIEIGSVASGTATINPDLSLDYSQMSQFSDILLTNRSSLEASAPDAGSIQLTGRNISVLDSSAVLAETLASSRLPTSPGEASPGKIDIAATGNVEVSGFTTEPTIPFNPPFFSYLSVDTAPGSTGSGGQITLQAQNLTLNNGGQIGAISYGSGDGGQIDLTIDSEVDLSGGSFFGPSGLFAVANPIGRGNSGQITVEAREFQMSEGAQVSASSFTTGTAGQITVTADQIELTGTSAPFEVPTPEGPIQGVSPTFIRSDMGETSTGKGQTVRLEANQISISEGAEVGTLTEGAGEAGDIEIFADDLLVSGRSPLGAEGPSSISTVVAPNAVGDGGGLRIETDSLRILDSAQVGTITAGFGQAGDISVEQAESVLISGQTPLGRSGLFASAINSTGAGGNLSVETETLRVTDGGTLNVSNFPSGVNAQLPPGQGDAGNLQVEADQIFLSEAGIISADTAAGDRGNITLRTETLTLRQNSQITANASGTSTGGNININAPQGFIVAVPSENSDITANAIFGDGGRINITAQSVLGIEPRASLTPLSDITTSSEFGLDGETQLETLDTEIRAENRPLPQSTDIPLVAQGCNVAGPNSSRFVQSGRGGLSNSPYGTLNSRDSLADTSLPSSLSGLSNTTNQAVGDRNTTRSNTITEAQGWNTNEQGEVVLIATNASEADRCVSWK